MSKPSQDELKTINEEADRIVALIEKGEKWMQKADKDIEKRGTKGVCTGDKFGGPSCPPGSKRYALAKTFKKIAKKK